MSALGMGSMKPKVETEKVAGMVVFKELAPAAGAAAGNASSSSNSTSTKDSKKKFGF